MLLARLPHQIIGAAIIKRVMQLTVVDDFCWPRKVGLFVLRVYLFHSSTVFACNCVEVAYLYCFYCVVFLKQTLGVFFYLFISFFYFFFMSRSARLRIIHELFVICTVVTGV